MINYNAAPKRVGAKLLTPLLASLSLLLFTQCNTPKQVVMPTEIRTTDTIFVKPQEETVTENPYRAAYERTVDLLHTDLNLTFNYAEKAINGKAKLTFTPIFYGVDEFTLDAKNFEIKEVSMAGKPLEYNYANDKLDISLPQTIERDQEFDVFIQYIARPYTAPSGGSAAIMSDRGLYFIDADESDEYKPTQIWTQGETESSSKWFPTIDKPNERCTQKIRIKVDSEYETLSNGLLTDSKDNGDGTRTDTWEMTKPHAPYLFMLAIGDFHKTTDTWEDVPLEYMVEHDYAKDVKGIFNYTPEMLSYFSNVLDYKYPWEKYSQVIVRDYVSGAMENTTASLYGQFLQRPLGDLVDNGNDRIVAHELFHHWFGDLVTCESWSNLTLNEGFANYSEYMWLAHKYGPDEGEQHRFNEMQAYFGQANQYAHPLIDFHFDDKEDMFDAHSYNKGGLVLHMLRDIVGDEAFFASLNNYLTTKEYEAAEVQDLRLAFEEVTGKDLNWFFNQWFLSPGHPQMKMEYTYSPESKMIMLTVDQLQEGNDWPIFRMETQVEIHTENGAKRTYDIVLDQAQNKFSFKLNDAPALVLLDPMKIQLAEMISQPEPSILLYDKSRSIWNRMLALDAINNLEGEEHEILVNKALRDSHWEARLKAMELGADLDIVKSQLSEIATKDPHANVRVSAVNLMETLDDDIMKMTLNDQSTRVQAAAAMKLYDQDAEAGMAWANKHENSTSQALLQSVADIFVDAEVPNKTAFFKKAADRMSFDTSFPFYMTWAGYVVYDEEAGVIDQLGEWSNQIESEDTDVYKKYAILTALQPLTQYLDLDKFSSENKEQVQGFIQKMGMTAMKLFGGQQ